MTDLTKFVEELEKAAARAFAESEKAASSGNPHAAIAHTSAASAIRTVAQCAKAALEPSEPVK